MAERPLLQPVPEALLLALMALRRSIAAQGRVVVAYSGGVDSALVAAIAAEQLAERAAAITGRSAALAPQLAQEAAEQAHWLGLTHRFIETDELADPLYLRNDGERCYACKRELHGLLARIAAESGDARVLDGLNVDDLGDHRPGIRAAQERNVLSPLAACGIDKAGVRQLSRALGLPWWDKPAQPCLGSRFPYGEGISAWRLQRVAAAEAWLRRLGFAELRVRSAGDSARIEIPEADLSTFLQRVDREALLRHFTAIGFTLVCLDLEGLVSGKLNRALDTGRGKPTRQGRVEPSNCG
ncbi:MAG: ATP-dependent sacrificial sulfur transferase LarE [Aphanocapsa feldmannii 277cV]|uniref:ATP-dependent sacrificial sulfur transferase LarE n=2 Tax=Aphanocapsa feldmannii TaxID=192050 RepID=A0A524RMT7_9CHRO|nr:MAG: ATP-dependent sacrificial sulfur transferase LarE [Aphanocapsa feldmannii 277cV]TGH22729.1 MAG: ATP-dependent sacrificial sulfur transferase LarE [Aphanocapsa feldmannii 277cI]